MAYNKFTMAQLQAEFQLEDRGIEATIDTDFYYLNNVEKIVGIILSMLG